MTYTEETVYKGWPVFEIKFMDKSEREQTLVSFGKRKARAIVDHIDEIRIFADKKD